MNKPREKMSLAMRAKQFMPFAALKGFEEAIALAERAEREPISFSEEMEETLNEKLSSVEKGKNVTLTYYSGGEYVMRSGVLTEFDPVLGLLRINDGEKVPFTDILDIEKED